MKKKIVLITILFLTTLVLGSFGRVQADTTSKTLAIKMLRDSGYGYQLNKSGNSSGTPKNVWKIYEPGGNANDIFYCLRGGPGFGTTNMDGNGTAATTYNYSADFRNKSKISDYISKLNLSDQNYNSLLWVLDNCAIDDSSRASLLANAKISSNSITADDIDSVQQVVIWHYTNQNDAYQVTGSFDFWLNTVKGVENSTYQSLSDFDNIDGMSGWTRAEKCQELYDYFIEKADAVKNGYTSSSSVEKPVKFQEGNNITISNATNSKIIVGPFRMNKQSDIYTLKELIVRDEAKNIISSYTFVKDMNGTSFESGITLEELVGQDFYLSIPSSNMNSKITLELKGSYTNTQITYWAPTANLTSQDQPVVQIKKTTTDFTDEITAQIPKLNFDLALRKFITSINGVAPEQDRTPQITNTEIDKLKNNSTTTVEKIHPKNPLTVKTGDKVIYTLRIYNEGDISGYATEVTDHLPNGLKLAENSQTNQTYGWTNPSGDGKTIVTNYLADKLLNKFNGSTLAYADLQIECEVIAKVGEQNQSLKNIAEITDDRDEHGNPIDDRDSTPNNVDKEHYEETSQEDDDDFEHLILEGKYFDLALRKFITGVEDPSKPEELPILNTRIPNPDTTPLKNGSGTTAIYNHTKNPIMVAKENIVTYTIRVYNEGEIDGYVEEITDHLPAELEFLPEDPLNVQYGWQKTDERTIKTTITGKNSAGLATLYKDREGGTLLKAFDGGDTLNYIDVKIRCKVRNTAVANKKMTNIAEISKFTDSEGNEVKDRDSDVTENKVKLPTDEELPNYRDPEIEKGDSYIPGQQDDDDFEKIILEEEKVFDLSLRKFITAVENEGKTTNYTREPKPVDTTPLKNGSGTTAIYNHPKNPIKVAKENIVTYTIRVYNEGEIDGYVEEITDHLPEQLEFLPEDPLNVQYGWQKTDERTIKTTITGKNSAGLDNLYKEREGGTLLKAFDGGDTLNYIDVKIRCKVRNTAVANQKMTNIAEISKFTDSEGKEVKDRDSDVTENKVKLPTDEELPNYRDPEIEKGDSYIPGQQDDDDFEKIILNEEKVFDLSLRKFITEVEDTSSTNEENKVKKYEREPKPIDTTPLTNGGTGTTANYNHPKNPIRVTKGDIVTYNIRVYNEGEIDGYVEEITDHLPEQLEFLPEDPLNIQYGWEKVNERTIKTTVTGKNSEKGKELYKEREGGTLLKAFEGGNAELNYIEVQIRCKVKDTAKVHEKITNIAQISKFVDSEGKEIKDRDSQENNVVLPTDEQLPNYRDPEIEKGDKYIPGQQDDDDFEKILVEEKIFDLALRKFITSINGVAPEKDRTPQIADTEIDKLKNQSTTTANKVHPKNPLTVKTGDRVIYTIRIYNEGELAGYAREVTDYLPNGLKLAENSQINQAYGWKNPSGDGKTIVTNYLADKLLKEFDGKKIDSVDLQIECEVIAQVGEQNQSLKNIAEITDDRDKDGKPVDDIDSTPKNVDKEHYGETNQEDDDDFEHLILEGKYFDLSLRKFITTIESNAGSKNYDRAPEVDVTPLVNGTKSTAIYNHPKYPIGVATGNIVTYTIRVYNEGQIDGYVTEITDHLPEQLEFLTSDPLNIKYGWAISEDGRTVKTTVTSPTTAHSANRDEIYKDRRTETDKVLLKAFDGIKLDYIDVQIKCKVKNNINLDQKITNIADITGFTDENGNKIKDRDSQENNVVIPTDEELPSYKDPEIENGNKYIPGQQDDDDFEKLVIQKFDLALRKFITGVNETEITNRAPIFNKVGENQYKYEHPKDPVEVANGNIVYYTLRIFNEGNIAGYAKEIKDNLPEGLQFLPDHELNKEYRWVMYKEDGTQTNNLEEAVSIRTHYLSKEQEKSPGANLIKAFDPATMSMPDYKDVKIAFKVTEPNTSDRIIINTAEISDDSDEEGNPVEDTDSTPDNDKDEEDDIDIEKIRVKYFDLSLKKWVSESIVTYNGKTTVNKTGHTGDENPEPPAKVEIRGSRLSKTTVKFKFHIKVTNEGEIAGYAKELIDYIPEGLKFVQEDNPNWREEDGKVLTDQLKDTLLQPGESATVEIILTWINSKNNLQEKVNWAEIYKDENEYNSPDIDSTPGNDQKGEDDIDRAPVVLSIVTGSAPTYIALILTSVSMLAGGVALIKKFVI